MVQNRGKIYITRTIPEQNRSHNNNNGNKVGNPPLPEQCPELRRRSKDDFISGILRLQCS